jgi:hypothetical protein
MSPFSGTRSLRGFNSTPSRRLGRPCLERSRSVALAPFRERLLVSGSGRPLTDEYGTHRRRPPPPAALRGRCSVGVQPARDLAERVPACVLAADASDDLCWQPRPAPRTRPLPALCTRRLSPLGEVTLELGDWDQPRSPLRPYRRDCRHDSAVERRQADAERLRRLVARVCEPLYPVREPGTARGRRRAGAASVSSLLRALPSLPARAHFIQRTSMVTLVCIVDASASRLLSRLVVAVRVGLEGRRQRSM